MTARLLPDLSAQAVTLLPDVVMVAGSLASSQRAGLSAAGLQPAVVVAVGLVPAVLVAVMVAV